MARITIDPKSRKAIISLKNLKKTSKQGIRLAFYDIGKSLVKDAKRSITEKPKSGRSYVVKVNGIRRRHRASAPGESPANLSGRLRKSIDFRVGSSYEMEFGAGEDVFGDGADYAGFLELGTSRMAKRPYLIKAINANERNIDNYLEKNIEKAIKKGM